MTLAARIQERLTYLGMTARRASMEAGLSPGAVGKMLTGESASPRAKNLRSLATVLGCSPEYLLGEAEEPGDIPGPLQHRSVLRMAGELKLRSWGEPGSPWDGPGVAFVPPMPDYPSDRQFAAVIADRHMDDLFLPGTVLHCIIPADDERARMGDIVVVIHGKFDGALYELTAREVVGGGHRYGLTTRFRQPELNDVIDFQPDDGNWLEGTDSEGQRVTIAGRVVRTYYEVSPPSLFERDDQRRFLDIVAAAKKIRSKD